MTSWTQHDQDGVRVLSFSNPPRNFLTFNAMSELGELLESTAESEDLDVVVLRSGVEGFFASHADLQDLIDLADDAGGAGERSRAWAVTMKTIERLPQPVIAAVNGQAWGGGLELALACDLRWGGPDATFAFVETALGIVPGAGGTQRAPRLLGRAHASELLVGGDVIGADRAHEIGLLGRLFTTDVDAEIFQAARRIARRPSPAVRAVKRVLRDSETLPARDGYALETQSFMSLVAEPSTRLLMEDALARYHRAPPWGLVPLDGSEVL